MIPFGGWWLLPVGLFIGLDESLSVGSYYSAVAGIESQFITAAAVYAYGKALVLNCAGAKQCVPGKDAFLGPVGGVEDCVVVVSVA